LERTISEQIAALPGKNKQQLLVIWRENFGKEAPAHLRKQLMVPVLAIASRSGNTAGYPMRPENSFANWQNPLNQNHRGQRKS
jgi:hypothetical protein